MSSYTAKDIQVLSAIDGIRRRPSMYIGSVDEQGLFHIFKEVVDNAVDESLVGRCSRIKIVLDEDSYLVADDGHGIPVERHRQTEISTLTTVFTHTHAGGKFGSKAYDSTIGVHGVGIKATNALSQNLEVWTHRDSRWWYQQFEYGVAKREDPSKLRGVPGVIDKLDLFPTKGTVIRFIPDSGIFKGADMNMDALYEWLHLVAYTNPQLTIEVVCLWDDEYNEEISYADGLSDYLDWMAEETEQKIEDRYHENAKEFECAIAFTDTQDLDNVYSLSWFTNSTHNESGGRHANAFWRAYTRIVRDYTGSGYYEDKDLKQYLIVALNVRIQEPQFSSQTKERLVDERADEIEDALYWSLDKYFGKHPKVIKRIIEYAVESCNKRRTGLVSKELAKDLKEASKTMLPQKLTAAPKCKPEKRELYILEGDSCAGTAIMARVSPDFQEILTLKGKFLNAARAQPGRIADSKEVFSILLAVGYDPKHPATHKLRVRGKIVLLADPDPDGYHINGLILTALAVMVPQVFEQRLVYIVNAPEYMAEYRSKRYYGRTREDLYKSLPKGAKDKVDVQHIKGWGEVSPEVLRDIAFDPKTRSLMRVAKPSNTDLSEYLGLMSHDVTRRKEILGIDINPF